MKCQNYRLPLREDKRWVFAIFEKLAITSKTHSCANTHCLAAFPSRENRSSSYCDTIMKCQNYRLPLREDKRWVFGKTHSCANTHCLTAFPSREKRSSSYGDTIMKCRNYRLPSREDKRWVFGKIYSGANTHCLAAFPSRENRSSSYGDTIMKCQNYRLPLREDKRWVFAIFEKLAITSKTHSCANTLCLAAFPSRENRSSSYGDTIMKCQKYRLPLREDKRWVPF